MPHDPSTPTVRLSGQIAFPAVTPRPAVVPGELLAGRYRLGRPVGAGGMGEVFEAEQLAPVRRTVAIKLVRDDGADIVPRLEAERQALARMSHPHIAAVFDAGTAPDGRPFVVMEFVRGVPLNQYVAAGQPTVRDRVDLLRQVCLAVQHAHAKGVIHRDLKPGNVLVEATDAGPVPKVIDFGLAKALQKPLTADPNLTAAGTVLGTPLYMAPEQTDPAADVDTRADVFALGVVLYELLAGTTPLDRDRLTRTPLLEVLRIIREEDVPRPSARAKDPATARLIRGDLDAVALKALARDPADRYETAAALADDLRRWLADEPVSAGRPTTRLRVRRFVRRNRAAVAATAAVLVALVAGVAGTTAGLVRAVRAEADARAALAQVEAEKRETVAARDHTRAALEAATDLTTRALLDHNPQLSGGEKQQLARLADLIGRLSDEAVSRPERVDWLVRVGQLHQHVGDRPRATDAYRRAVAAADESPADPALAGAARVRLGRHLSQVGEYPAAGTDLRRAVEQLTPLEAADPRAAADLVEAYEVLAFVDSFDRPQDAVTAAANQALAVFARQEAAGTTLPRAVTAAAKATHALAIVAQARSGWAEFLAHEQAALRLYERATAADPTTPTHRLQLAQAHYNLFLPLYRLGRRAEAEAALREGLRRAEAGLAVYPGLIELRVLYAGAANNLGTLLANSLRPADAMTQFSHAIDALGPLVGSDVSIPVQARVTLAAALTGRGHLRFQRDEPKAAEADFRRLIALTEGERRGLARYTLGLALAAQGKPEAAAAEGDAVVRDAQTRSVSLSAAYLYAVCSVADGVPPADADRYAAAAVAQIARQASLGLPTGGPLRDERRLAPFRARPGVTTLLAGRRLEAAPAPRVAGQ